MLYAWGFALLLSLFFKLWAFAHPEPFLIRPFLVWFLLLAPTLLIGFWLFLVGFSNGRD